MNGIDKLRDLIGALDLEEHDKITHLIDLIAKDIEVKDFQVKRLEVDSNLINNILTNTIEELETKKVVLEKQNQLIEEQSRFKETLFANVSHELRTPLHGIIGMSRLLFNSPLNNDQLEFVEIVKSSADNLLVIINDILNLSKINSGSIELSNDVFETATLSKDLKGILQEKAKRKQLKVNFLIPSSFPKHLVGDYTRIFQILLNLLNNAIKFTAKGQVSLTAAVISISKQDTEIRFDITDSGIGMKQEKLSQIFDSFVQVHEQKGIIYEGAGLGLNIVRNLLNLMSGTISVESQLNVGTSFCVKIPLKLPTPNAIAEFNAKKSSVDQKENWNLQKVLIIEDNKANMLYARKLLGEHGIVPDKAVSLASARQFVANFKYNYLLVDVKLPDGNGIDLIKEIRNDKNSPNYTTNILVLTASANEIQKNSLKHLNISAYLPKPFPPETLLNELRKSQEKIHDREEQKRVEIKKLDGLVKTTNQRQIKFSTFIDQNETGYKNLLIELLKIYLDELPIVVSEFKEGLLQKDHKIIGFQAHKFASNNRYLGFDQTVTLLKKLEQMANDQVSFDRIEPVLSQCNTLMIEDQQLVENQLQIFNTQETK